MSDSAQVSLSHLHMHEALNFSVFGWCDEQAKTSEKSTLEQLSYTNSLSRTMRPLLDALGRPLIFFSPSSLQTFTSARQSWFIHGPVHSLLDRFGQRVLPIHEHVCEWARVRDLDVFSTHMLQVYSGDHSLFRTAGPFWFKPFTGPALWLLSPPRVGALVRLCVPTRVS